MTNRIARLRGRLTYANVTATLALFIALGGTSYAAITLPRNSVGAKQIRAGAIGSSEIRNRAIHVKDISRPRPQGAARPARAGGPGRTLRDHRVRSDRLKLGVRCTGPRSDVVLGRERTGGTSARVRDATCRSAPTRRPWPTCRAATSPTAVPGRVTVASAGGPAIIVKTYDAAGNPAELPFHVIVAC